jgi:hypothetical protein
MPVYIFACSTTNATQTITLDIRDPPLRLSIVLSGTPLEVKIIMFGTPAFYLHVTSEQPLTDIPFIAGVLGNAMSGLYDALGLSVGVALSVRLDGYQLVGSNTFAQFSPSLPRFGEAISQAGLDPHDWIMLALQSEHLTAALRDLRLAMQTSTDVATHCYRAIERIRHSFSTGERDRSISWGRLREALCLDRSWLDTYAEHATAVRHGELMALTLEERDKCLTQAATVAIRYAVYLKGGAQSLSPLAFPLLTA